MNIYFCEKCGERVTSVEIEQNRGTQTAEHKVYCQNCSKDLNQPPAPRKESARGIQPASPRSSARNIPAVRRDSAPSITAPSPSPPSSSSSMAKQQVRMEAAAPAVKSTSWAMIGGIGAFVALVVIGIGIGFSGSGKPAPGKTVASTEPGETQPAREKSPPKQPSATPIKNPPRVENASADEAFAKLIKFEGLQPGDKAGRINLIEEYLKNNPESAKAPV